MKALNRAHHLGMSPFIRRKRVASQAMNSNSDYGPESRAGIYFPESPLRPEAEIEKITEF